MEYTTKFNLTCDLLKDSRITPELIKRDAIYRLINDMPIEALEKIFNVTIYDPLSDEIQNIINDPLSQHPLLNKFTHLYEERVVEYNITINTD